MECGFPGNRIGGGGNPLLSGPIVPPWSPSGAGYAWSIFAHAPESCDQEVAYSEALLCTANELAKVADAIAPIRWNGVDGTSPFTGFPPGPWSIPVQSNKDRFILRDLAIYLLANLALTDMKVPTNGGTNPETCSTVYARALTDSSFATDPVKAPWLFGVGPTGTTQYFPPMEPTRRVVNTTNLTDLARSRLEFNTQILRSASRLLEELIRKSVEADMAGAEQRRARATDPERGSAVAWAQQEAANGSYNTLGHALRVLSGRWELARNPNARAFFDNKFYTVDPACGGVAAGKLLSPDSPNAYGPDLSARVNDKGITTASQKAAMEIVTNAGLIVPKAHVAVNLAGARTALRKQMLGLAAQSNGITPGDSNFEQTGMGKSLTYVLDTVSDADLTFALERGFSQYNLLTATPDTFGSAAIMAGLKPAAYVAPELATVGAVALKDGIPRQDLAVDIMSRAGGILESAQCDEYQSFLGQVYAADNAYTSTFQDSFSIGQALGRRLVALREAAKGSVPATDGLVVRAEEAAGEVRAWSGPGRMAVTSVPNEVGVSEIWLFTFGLDPKELAASTPEKMQDQIVLVHGEPWVADCAAGLRTNCPDNFEANYVVSKTSALVSDGPGLPTNWKALTGSDGTFGWFIFPGTKPDFHPAYIGVSTPETHLYVVARHDPQNPSSKGRVLGSAALRFPYGGTGGVISDLQRKLLNDVMGIGAKWRDQGVGIGQPSMSRSPGYCIEGVPKNLFVPLENELTSDSDQYENSWKHYLALAKQAAQRADDLGQKLIDIGLQQDLRQEAAGEELAALCGEFGALDKIKVEGGQVNPPKDDATLQTCLQEDRADVVFLTKDPFDKDNTARLNFVREQLKCPATPDPNNTNEVCNKNFPALKVSWLGLADYAAPPAVPQDVCADVAALAGSLRTGYQGQQYSVLAAEDWATAAKIKYLANRLHAQMDADGTWRLLLSGVPVMDSEAGALWPGCRRQNQGCADGPGAALFDSIFRTSTGPLGSGTPGSNAEDNEATIILWRVQGALWTLGALSGSIPKKMFLTQIPAVNFNSTAWPDDEKSAPAFTVFGTGKFANCTTPPCDLETANLPAEREELGPGYSIPDNFHWPATNEVPTWLFDLYYPDSASCPPPPGGECRRYLHVTAESSEYTGFDVVKNPSDWLGTQLKNFADVKCANGADLKLAGAPGSGPTPTQGNAEKAVAALRRGKQWASVCRNQAGDSLMALDVTSSGSFASTFRDRYSPAASTVAPLAWELAKQDVPLFPKFTPDNQINEGSNAFRVYLMGQSEPGTGPATHAPNCWHASSGGIRTVHYSCVEKDEYFSSSNWFRYTQRVLRPTVCGAGARAPVFVNSYPPAGVCGAAAQVTQALALSCKLNAGVSDDVPIEKPEITTLADLDGFVIWIDSLSRRARYQLSKLHVEKVPQKVVEDFTKLDVGTNGAKGEHGTLLLELRKSLETLAGAWNRTTGDLEQLRNAVDTARLSINGAKIDKDSALASLAIQRMQIHANMISAAAGAVSINPAGAVNAGAQIELGNQMLTKTEQLEELAADKETNTVALALNQLQLTSGPVYTDLQNALGDIRSSTATVLSINAQLQQNENKAKYEAAKGSGAPYVEIDGEVVTFPVNVVQSRLYDITRRRYEAALREAKYLAYVARLAIEQRIGVQLDTIDTPVGPLDPPHVWADDVCSLTGVDYQKLHTVDIPDGGVDAAALEQHEKDLVAEFADQYIGDYVAKLENFVEYYNIAYPSHDGDDTAVLSLRDDLLGPAAGCIKDSPNLLLYSTDLRASDAITDGTETKTRGWETNACDPWDTKCLTVDPSGALAAQPPLPKTGATGGFVWLHEIPPVFTPTVPAGSPTPNATDPPPRSVSQTVDLVGGSTYVLSWWDQARAGNGDYLPSSQSGVKYRVRVLGTDGAVVAESAVTPFTPASATADPQWSARRSLEVKATQSGKYRVAFGASFDGAELGSVLVANVQLEQAPPGALPGPFIFTASSLLYLAPNCTGRTAEDVQKAFRHVCDANKQCYYELVAPIVIDTKGVAEGKSRLSGKLAAGNFNFRHITLAVNLAGTGVYDCSANPSQSCFGSAFIEYTIDHDAFQAGIVSWNGDVQTFNFGSAGINHAKALAAEKYITLPIGSGDQNLLAQPGIEKPEYRGRPLDGSYRIKIWDSPYLVWNRLEDVQVILKYRYWSKIQPQPTGQ